MSTSDETRKGGSPCEEGKGSFFFFRKNKGKDKVCRTDQAALDKGAPHDSSKEGVEDQDIRKSGSQAEPAEEEEHTKEEIGNKEKEKGKGKKGSNLPKGGKENGVQDATKRKNIKGGTNRMSKTVSTSKERDSLNEPTRSPNAGDVSPESSSDKPKHVHSETKDLAEDASQMSNGAASVMDDKANDSSHDTSRTPSKKHATQIIKNTMEEQELDEDTTNSSSKEVDDDRHSVILQREEENFLAENSINTGSFEPNEKNEIDLQELNEHNNNSDDDSNVNKGKCEIDNRIKRKMHSLKQNEEKKKKKTDTDNAPSIASDSSDEEDVDSKEKLSDNSANEIFDKKDKDDAKEKKKNGSKEDHVIYADEALKGYPRIFVTRLPFEAGKKDLEKYFSKYGKIVDIYVSKNLSNNKNKGFGFVSFEKQSSMDKVLKDKLHIICGKEIVVDVASMRDSKTKHLFHLPSDHYLAKYPKNDRKSPSRTHNNLINFNKYHNVYNKTNNIRDMSKNIDNNLVMQNFYNLCPTYNILGNRMNNKQIYKNNMPMPIFPPAGYNMDPAYFNNQQMPYQNCLDYMGNDYYWNMANYYNWNNMMFHNENLYNAKKMEYPYYVCNGQYMNQSPPPIVKNKMQRKNSPMEESMMKYPPNVLPGGGYRSPGQPFVRKLPGGDEWNKRGYKLFVTKLNSVTTIETLRNYFEAFGEIIDIYMPNDVCTNRPRGIAFVTFLDNDCVKKILSNKNSKHIIDGKEVVVDLADPETKTKKNMCYP
ncbi:nucleic acid binding protein, putative [Plasmodium knowlesi strain H]|uniref:Nucleic acid binding protein, putative n=3 Tax=Plasmodium knowlesi TaxID=5850 RepID=A0A5K1U387_PLAKH|nr:nucleic acid binding protein, putative [Plasmodium knowlesi strain H]OTN64804.1 putative Nucleic acid binding factor [Plasmodium knowlesi]CAA9988097.1 nucleic acid binding protein, putative [Plasmodium knowlesi strain H]SBO19962.1 nucleic acid binding protein, putative [Plasmodium knowlesi strain H]SBO29100.1 nucleic acid binding protein, putative [Plasmodium knowlesi strain H]VVS77571.1 nucleic acid binding protein, putative [Plasmodium knowlesi strain H]|eukprot:XP_002259071.1 nucleic acid binding factor, putative [Plasmodium knowlesi strain H]